jgi:hypothetical protein
MNFLVRYYTLKGFHLFFGIVFTNLFLIWLSRTVLINEIVFYNTYSEQLSYDRSLMLFENLKKLEWMSYVLNPVILLIKFSLISFVVYVGIFLSNVQTRISLGSVFKIVIASEAIYVVVGFIKFFWFYLFAGNYDLNDLAFFYPLSLINFFSREEVSRIWILPMQTINLFHLFYIISISYGLSQVCSIDRTDSDKIVLLSYLPALFLWIVLIMFITINISS